MHDKWLAGLLRLPPNAGSVPSPGGFPFPVRSHLGSLAVLPGETRGRSAWDLRDLLLQGAPEELEQEVSLSGAGGVTVEAEDHRLHEPGRLVGWHLDEQPGQIHWLSLEGGKHQWLSWAGCHIRLPVPRAASNR